MGRPKGSKNKTSIAVVQDKTNEIIIASSQPARYGDTRKSSGNIYYSHIHRVLLGPPDWFVFFVTKNGMEYKSIEFDDIHVCHAALLSFLGEDYVSK